ncbi:hypothetical protein, partial [Escherichia coli]|uniref:hypothetical protein n=1 Tax=Escherichia coli TaxID=562 RepID=UPI00398927F7
RKRAYCLKIQPATGSFARNLIYSTKPAEGQRLKESTLSGAYAPFTFSVTPYVHPHRLFASAHKYAFSLVKNDFLRD